MSFEFSIDMYVKFAYVWLYLSIDLKSFFVKTDYLIKYSYCTSVSLNYGNYFNGHNIYVIKDRFSKKLYAVFFFTWYGGLSYQFFKKIKKNVLIQVKLIIYYSST